MAAWALGFKLVENSLQSFFVLVALHAFDNFAALKDKNCWNSRNAVLNCQRHVLANVDFANFGFAFVVGCQLINDWTQSLARRSAIGIKIDQHW